MCFIGLLSIGFIWSVLSTDNLLDPLELKIFVLSLAYLGNAHVHIILSLA